MGTPALNMKVLIAFLLFFSLTLAQECTTDGLIRRWVSKDNSGLTFVTTPEAQPSSEKNEGLCPDLGSKDQCCSKATYDRIKAIVEEWTTGLNTVLDSTKASMDQIANTQEQLIANLNEAIDKAAQDGKLKIGDKEIDAEKFKKAFKNFMEKMIVFLKNFIPKIATCFGEVVKHFKGAFCLTCYTETDVKNFVSVVSTNNGARKLAIKYRESVCDDLKAACEPLVRNSFDEVVTAAKNFLNELGINDMTGGSAVGITIPEVDAPCTDDNTCRAYVCGTLLGSELKVSATSGGMGSLLNDGAKGLTKRDLIDVKRDTEQTGDTADPTFTSDGFNSVEEGSKFEGDVKTYPTVAPAPGNAGRLMANIFVGLCFAA